MARFIEAAKAGNTGRIKEMLRNGSSINCVDPKDQSTALYWAACHGHHELCGSLLGQGANVHLPVKWGSLPIHGAADRGHRECLELLISHHSPIDAQNENLDTPLHLGACRGYLEICRVLIQNGAQQFVVNKQQKTPMDEARSNQHTEVFKLLVNFKKAPLCKDIRQRSRILDPKEQNDNGNRHTAPVNSSHPNRLSLPPKPTTDPLIGKPVGCGHPGQDNGPCPQCHMSLEEQRMKTWQSLHENFEEVGETKEMTSKERDQATNEARKLNLQRGNSSPLTNGHSRAMDHVVNSNRSHSATDLRTHVLTSSPSAGNLADEDVNTAVPSWNSLTNLSSIPASQQFEESTDLSHVPAPRLDPATRQNVVRSHSDGPQRLSAPVSRASSPDPIRYQQMKELVKKLTHRIDQLESEKECMRSELQRKDEIIQRNAGEINDLIKMNQLLGRPRPLEAYTQELRDEMKSVPMHHTAPQPQAQSSRWSNYGQGEMALLGMHPAGHTTAPVRSTDHPSMHTFGDLGQNESSRRQRLISRCVEGEGVSTAQTTTPSNLMVYTVLLSVLRSAGYTVLQSLFVALLNTLRDTLPAIPISANVLGRPWKLNIDYCICGEPLHLEGSASWTVPIQRGREHNVLQITSELAEDFGWRVLTSVPSHPNITWLPYVFQDSVIPPLKSQVSGNADQRSRPVMYCVTEDYPHSLQTFIQSQQTPGSSNQSLLLEWFLLQTFYQLLSAIEHLFENHILHQNIAAESIFLDKNLRLRLGGWHRARRLSDPRSLVDVHRFEDTDTKNDILAVGLLMNDVLRTGTKSDASSPRLERILEGCMKESVTERLGAAEARMRVGSLLFGPQRGEVTSETDATIWLLSKALTRLAQPTSPTETGPLEEGRPVLTLAEAVEINQDFLERNFLCSVNPPQLWETIRMAED